MNAKVMIATAVFGCLLANAAAAGSLPAPGLKEGKFVYTIPEGFEPPLIGERGLAEIEAAARGLRLPFYVVISAKLPGTTDEDAAAAVDGLAEDWANKYPSFDSAKSQVFLLTYEPRKYRFLAGAKWKAELGFEKDAHRPHTALFERAAKGTPKDPKGGIIAVMRSVDEYLFDQTDPARVAARAEAARKAEQARFLQGARGALDAEILRLDGLLKETDYLPSDTTAAAALLQKARELRQQDNPQTMLEMTASMRPSVDVLERHINLKRSEARAAMFAVVFKWMLLAVSVIVALFLALRRRAFFIKQRTEFNGVVAEWEQKIKNAAGKYVDFYGERDSVVAMKDAGGETAALFRAVTGEVDAIYAAVRAMEFHLEKCQALAAQAGYFRFAPLMQARQNLEGEFDFDTKQLNEADLFGKETKIIKVTPEKFAADLQARYAASIKDWKRLKLVGNVRREPAEKAFPQTKLEALFKLAEETNIPSCWLADHPLFGDDASDKNLYESLNVLRLADPVAYMSKLYGLKDKEAEIVSRLNRLVQAVNFARDERLPVAPDLAGTIVDPSDDPTVSFDNARREEDKLAGRLAGRDKVEEIVEQARAVHDLYQKATEQAATIKRAVEEAKESIQDAESAKSETRAKKSEAQQSAAEAQRTHRGVKAHSYIADGDKFLAAGERDLDKAKRQLDENRHLNARRNADKAAEQFREAAKEFVQAAKHCRALEEQKEEYLRRAAQAGETRARHEQKIHGFGGRANLPPFTAPVSDGGAMDYALLLGQLAAVENTWQAEERRAQAAYNAEQAHLRQQREAERRRQEEEEAASRRQSSHYSSSSGSGWGGSDSSSSGGGWDGGGSSSSGGSW